MRSYDGVKSRSLSLDCKLSQSTLTAALDDRSVVWVLHIPSTSSCYVYRARIAILTPIGRAVTIDRRMQHYFISFPSFLCQLASILLGPPYYVSYDVARKSVPPLSPFRVHYRRITIPLGRKLYISTQTLEERAYLRRVNAPIVPGPSRPPLRLPEGQGRDEYMGYYDTPSPPGPYTPLP